MTKRKDIVLICEDRQQEVFVRRFLEGFGIEARRFVIVRAPKDRGAGVGDVAAKFPKELAAHRKLKTKSKDARLIAITDADLVTTDARLKQLNDRCLAVDPPIQFREQDERVSIFIPKRNIETWIHFVLNRTPVDETTLYSKYKGRERKPQAEIREFARNCKKQNMNNANSFPPSLSQACNEFKSRFLGE